MKASALAATAASHRSHDSRISNGIG